MKRFLFTVSCLLMISGIVFTGCSRASTANTSANAPSPGRCIHDGAVFPRRVRVLSLPRAAPSTTPPPAPTKTPIEEILIDYEAISALDGTKRTAGGRAPEKDDLNCPCRRLSAQETYGKYSALFITARGTEILPYV